MNDFKKSFPDFYERYENIIDFHEDTTLTCGIEIVNKDYFVDLSEAIAFINDFFDDYSLQERWSFTNATSIHVNIGVNGKKPKWNIVKGVVMLADVNMKQPEELKGWEEWISPFVFKDIYSREDNEWCKSLKYRVLNDITSFNIKTYNDLIKSNNIAEIENLLGDIIKSHIDPPKPNTTQNKSFGFNISKIIQNQDYVEFRYIGGENINEKIVIEKLKYFCYIIYLMTTEFNRKQYTKKLYLFIDKIRENIAKKNIRQIAK